jgi:hypothetical protein
MAENSEERKVRIVLDAQQPNASLKEMGAGLAVLNSQLSKMAQDDPGREKLQQDYARLNARIAETRAEMRLVIKTEEELAEEHRKLAEAAERVNQENREVILNGQKVEATFGQMKLAAAQLERQLHDVASDDPGRAKMIKDYRELQDRIEGVKKEMGEAADQGLTFKDALAFAGVTVSAEAALDMLKELGAEVINTTKELGKMRADINGLTGATGAELDELAVGVRGLSQMFGKEYNEVLVASNALSKQMGISQKEALSLLEKGFVAGADINGEFLDQVKEYPGQFKAAGVSASEFIAIVSKSQTDGVFSDKGADVVKEFGLRIREQTKSTSDAMEAAFGTEFTQKLFKGINDGSITSVQALQQVSQQMNDTKIPASQLQTVIADVFGGPGEDAGIEYLKSLKNIGGGIDTLIDQTNPYVLQQQRLLASQKELAGAQNDLAKEFEGTGASVEVLTNGAMTFLYTLLASLAVTFKELYAPVQEIWQELLELGESMGLVSKEGSLVKDIATGIGTVLRVLLIPLKLSYEGFAMAAKGIIEWAKQSEIARGFLYLMVAPIRNLYNILMEGPAYFAGWSASADAAFSRVGAGIKAALRGDFDGAKREFGALGSDAASSFQKAFTAALAKEGPVQAKSTVAAGGVEPPTRAAGGDGTTQAQRDKAASDAQKAREKERKERLTAQKKHDQESLDATKVWVKAEGQELEFRNTLSAQRDRAGYNDELLRRDQQRQKLFEAATAQVGKLTGQEQDYSEQLEAIVKDRDLALRELQAKFDAEDEKRRQEAIDKKIAIAQAEQEQALAELDLKLAGGQFTEQAYQDAVYAVKQSANEREMALIKEKLGAESVEYKKLTTEKTQNDADYAAKKKKLDGDQSNFEKAIALGRKLMSSEEVTMLMDSLGKKTVLYKAAMALQKTLAIAEIAMSVPKQWAANSEAGAKISAMAPPFTVPLGVAYTVASNALSTAGAAAATAKILGLGFREGGPTGGAQVGANGKLLDAAGFPIAGVVHENEYVIPEWLRKDPQVVQVEQWLEAKRQQRGFIVGGPTSQAAPPVVTGDSAGGGDMAQLLRENRDVLLQLSSRLGKMESWATTLQVVQHTGELDDDLAYVKKVKAAGGIS